MNKNTNEKSHRIYLRVSQNEKKRITELANSCDLSVAEYYSVELAQKINRGLALNAENVYRMVAILVLDLKLIRKIKTSIGNEFTYNSFSRILKNKRYIGVYLYKGVETPRGMPRILDDDLFYRVQEIIGCK